MKKKLWFKILVVAVLGLIVGFINTAMIYQGLWTHFFKGIGAIPWYIHVLIGFLALFLVILAHELGHYIEFVKKGIPVKALYVLCLAFVKIDGKWKLRFVPKFLLLLGGIVIPDEIEITNKSEEDEFINIVKRVLLKGPQASIIYGSSIFLLWLVFLPFEIFILNGVLFTLMLVTTIMTILAILSSKVSHNGMYGDFVAEKKLDTDHLFRLTYLLQATTLIERSDKSIKYLWPDLIKTLENAYLPSNSLYAGLLLTYLNEVAFEGAIGSVAIDNKIDKQVKRLPKTEEGFLVYNHIIYFYQSRGNQEKANQLLEELEQQGFKLKDEVKDYHIHLTNHLLKRSDESNFLDNPKNQHPNSMNFVYKPLELKDEIKDIHLWK